MKSTVPVLFLTLFLASGIPAQDQEPEPLQRPTRLERAPRGERTAPGDRSGARARMPLAGMWLVEAVEPGKGQSTPRVVAAELVRGLKATLDAQNPTTISHPKSRFFNFDAESPGTLPGGWAIKMTSSGGVPQWEVLRDSTGPSTPHVLAQVSTDATRGRYPLAIFEDVNCKDGELSVRFKPVSGKVDQAAGLVWRYRDENNYYLVRANALENNVVLYKVESGIRTPLAPKGMPAKTFGDNRPVPSKAWSVLRVVFQGTLFTVYFDGHRLFEVEESTFLGPGKVGLWTKADSVTYFDDFQVTEK